MRHNRPPDCQPPSGDIRCGDRVFVNHLGCYGTARFVGLIPNVPGEWVGVELEDAKGNSDGTICSVRCFECPPKHAIFLRGSALQKDLNNGCLQSPKSVATFKPVVNVLEQKEEVLFLQQQPLAEQLGDKLKTEGSFSRLLSESFPRAHSALDEAMILDPDTGTELDWPPTERNLELLREHFETNYNQPAPIAYVQRLMVLSQELLLQTGTLAEGVVAAGQHTQMVVVGDIHGQLNDLLWILHVHGPPSLTGNQYFFNGDFVDRGEYGMEVLVLILTMKCVWPKSVFLNRGNHENLAANINYGFARECHTKYNAYTMQLCQAMFEALPLAHVLSGRIFVVHGGLSRYDNFLLGHIAELPRCTQILGAPATMQDSVLFDLQWADPIPTFGRVNGGRGPETWQFGPDVTHEFLQNNRLSYIVRSHQVPSSGQGFEVTHDGKLITVFSASNYCGYTGNMGAVLVIYEDLRFEASEYFSPPLAELRQAVAAGLARPGSPPADDAQMLGATLRLIRQFIMEKKDGLRSRFQSVANGQGPLVTVLQWIQTMAFTLALDLDWQQLQPHLAEANEAGLIDYEAFLNRFRVEPGPILATWVQSVRQSLWQRIVQSKLSLQEMMDLFDLDRNGVVDQEELRRALSSLDMRATPSQLIELTQDLLQNEKGEVPVTAFLESLQRRAEGIGHLMLDDRSEQVLRRLQRLVRLQGATEMVKLFESVDTSGNGKVEYQEFFDAMAPLVYGAGLSGEITDDDLMALVQALDTTKSGTLCYLEFLDAFAPYDMGQKLVNHILTTLQKHRIGLERAFFLLDQTGEGFITKEKFTEGLEALNTLVDGCFQLSRQDIELLVQHLDTNEDGCVDYAEFCNAFTVVDTHGIASCPESFRGWRNATKFGQ
eukprot:EG_transcript_1851